MSGHHNEILGRVWTKSPNSELVRQVRLLPMVLSAGKIRSYAGEDKLQRNQTAILVDTVFFCYWHETDMPTLLRNVRS
jgi:hypothetical protein